MSESVSPTVSCKVEGYPLIDQFAEELVKEPKWYTLGIFLGVPTHELDAINLGYSSEGIMRCLIEVHKYIQSNDIYLSWARVAKCLERMNNLYLARLIKDKYIAESSKSGGASVLPHQPNLKNVTTSIEHSQRVTVCEEVKSDFLMLMKSFGALVIDVKNALKESSISLEDIQGFIEEHCNLEPLPEGDATLDKIFSRLRQHCSLLNYTILIFLVDIFLSSNMPIKQKVAGYIEATENFKTSAKLKDLMDVIERETLNDQHKIIKLKLREFWSTIVLKKFERMVSEILETLYDRISHIKVDKGCICVSWVIPDIDTSELVQPKPLELIRLIGIVSLHIGDKVVYDIPGEGCEIMDAAMLQAVELKNTRAVEILLAMGCDPEMAMYNEYSTVANILDIGRRGEKPCLVQNVYMVRHPKDAHVAVPSGKADSEIEGEINVYLMQEIDRLKKALEQKG